MSLKVILFIVATLLILLVVVVLIRTSSFKRKVEAEVVKMFENRERADTAVVTESDLARLPPPVQRYLRYSQVLGKPRIQTVRLRQKGFFRQKPDQAWTALTAQQYYTVYPQAFLWFARLRAFPLVSIVGRDLYVNGRGNMLITLLSTVTVADASGPELNQGTLLRFLNEMMWFPTAWLSDYLTWQAIDSSSAKVTMEYGGTRASATLHINETGELTNFVAERYMTVDSGFVLERWSTPVAGYTEMNGFRIPTKGQGIWHLQSGDFPYVQLEIDSIEYDRASVF